MGEGDRQTGRCGGGGVTVREIHATETKPVRVREKKQHEWRGGRWDGEEEGGGVGGGWGRHEE